MTGGVAADQVFNEAAADHHSSDSSTFAIDAPAGGSGGSGDDPPAAGVSPLPAPALGLPVAELVGLRFSVVHLRLAGYALVGVWLSEITGLLTAPLLQAVGTRLHYISQALDVSPLLLVGIALVAFQGGLQRSWLERLLLPVLFALLPLLSALHFVMAPASIANALTLSGKQQEVSRSQLTTIQGQLDRAEQVLLSSQDLEDLRRRLDAIPGVRVSSSPDLTLEEARRQVGEALQNERRRVRAQIGVSTAQAREQFTRRALQNAGLGILIGVMLAWLRASALEEMSLSSTYLTWMLVADPSAAKLSGLKALIDFQNSCLATSYLALIERLTKLGSRARDKEEEERQKQMERDLLERLNLPQAQEQPPAPWEPARLELRPETWRRQAGIFHGDPGSETLPVGEAEEGFVPEEGPLAPQTLSPREVRRQQRDRERVRNAMEQFARMVSDYEPAEGEGGPPQGRRRRGPSQRQLRKAREALERFAKQFEEDMAVAEAEAAEAEMTPVSPLGFEDPAAADGGVPLPGVVLGDASAAGGGEGSGPEGPDGPSALPQAPLPLPPPQPESRNPLRRALDWLVDHL